MAGGNINLIGPSASVTTVTETLGVPTFARGQSTITVTSTAAQGGTNLVLGLPNNPSTTINNTTVPTGATALFRGTSLGTAAGAGISTIASTGAGFTFVGQTGATATTNKGVIPWALVDNTATGLGVSFATSTAAAAAAGTGTAVLRVLDTGTEMASSLTVDTNVRLTSAPSAIDTRRINSLTLESAGGVTMKPLDLLTIQSGGILTKAGNTGISGGVLSYPGGGTPLIIHAVGLASDNTTITSLLQGGNGQGNGNISFIKTGNGILTLQPGASAIAGVGGNVAGGQTEINQGALKLDGGNNTLYFNNFLSLIRPPSGPRDTGEIVPRLRSPTPSSRQSGRKVSPRLLRRRHCICVCIAFIGSCGFGAVATDACEGTVEALEKIVPTYPRAFPGAVVFQKRRRQQLRPRRSSPVFEENGIFTTGLTNPRSPRAIFTRRCRFQGRRLRPRRYAPSISSTTPREELEPDATVLTLDNNVGTLLW